MFLFPWQPRGDFKNGPIAKKPSIEVLYLCAKFQCSNFKSSENGQNRHVFPPFCVAYSTIYKYQTHYDGLQPNMPPDSEIRALSDGANFKLMGAIQLKL